MSSTRLASNLFETVLRLHLGEPLLALARRTRASAGRRLDWTMFGSTLNLPMMPATSR